MRFISESCALVDMTGEAIPSFEDVQKMLGGFVEVIKLPTDYRGHRWLLVDKDGQLRRRPVNGRASRIAGTVIAGPGLLLTSAEARAIL